MNGCGSYVQTQGEGIEYLNSTSHGTEKERPSRLPDLPARPAKNKERCGETIYPTKHISFHRITYPPSLEESKTSVPIIGAASNLPCGLAVGVISPPPRTHV